jgi:hypothetical protein
VPSASSGVANQYPFGELFGRDLTSPERRGHYRQMLSDMVVTYLTGATDVSGEPAGPPPDWPRPVGRLDD